MLTYIQTLLAISISVVALLWGCTQQKEKIETESQVDEEISVEYETSEPDEADVEEDVEEDTPFAADAAPSANMGMSKSEAVGAAQATGLLGQANALNSMELDWSDFDASAQAASAGYGLGASGTGGGGAGMGGFGAGGFGPGGGGGGGGYIGGYQAPEFGDPFAGLNENEFRSFQPNQFKNVLNSPFSTFGADVDTASYSILRYYIQNLHIAPIDQLLRTEEMLNYFKYDYPNPQEGEPFSMTTELVNTPWNKGTQLLLIGMQTPKLKEIPRSNIVYLIDVSGSMDDEDKLPFLKRSIIESLDSFTENDTISIVTYASSEKLHLSGANPVRDRKIIEATVNALVADGSTYGERGLEMAYEQAAKYFIPGGNNRIIMGTDGDLNVGISSENELKAYVEQKRKNGIFLSILGFGWGNLKDNRMEALADNGNGSYHYIDTINEAKRVLIEDRESTLFTVAKDVKFQIDFNPSKVKGYRLIGYETRKLNTEDFKDDKKDGGEIGANQQMTVLYEIVPAGSNIKVEKTISTYQKIESVPSEDLATLAVRYKKPDENTSQEIKHVITSQVSTQMSENIQFAAAVAEVGMLLNHSDFKGSSTYESARKLLEPLTSVESDLYRIEFLEMVKQLPTLVSLAEKQKREREKQEREYKKQMEEQERAYKKQMEERKKLYKKQLETCERESKRHPEKYATPKIVMKKPDVTGAIDKRIIQKVVRQHTGELRACYERELNKIKGLNGRVVLDWIISPQGAVKTAIVKESTIKNKNVENCVVNSVKYWRFPPPKGGGMAQVEYPFEFKLEPQSCSDFYNIDTW
ncbi:MAG: von Willebrand factor type A domain-containing protein [Proteobacteria bacterium]|nr:von Willebrand factor type A domain-containing protein [Pseudomonadota bacterium]